MVGLMPVNPNFAKSQPHNGLCLPDEIVPMRCGFALYETAAQARRPSPNWDINLPPFDGPLDAEAIPQGGDWQATDVVASQFERALAADGGLGVGGEGGQTIHFLENAQEEAGGLDGSCPPNLRIK
jgi:hypothetical protein